MRRVGRANGVAGVDLDDDVQAVVAQDNCVRGGCVAAVARALRRVAQGGTQHATLDAIAGHVAVRAFGQWHDLIEKVAPPSHDARPACGVKSLACGQIAQRIGAVQRVIKAAPAGVGRVQRVTRVHHRHDQLRPRDRGDLGVSIAGLDVEIVAFRFQIADFAQEIAVGRGVRCFAPVGNMPGIDLALQGVATCKTGAVFRAQLMYRVGKPLPEGGGLHAGARQRQVFDKPHHGRVYL